MIFDLAKPESLPNSNYDYCICGSGAAGITAALKLSQAGAKVALLEGGGLDYDQKSQQIYETESTGMELWPGNTRLRFFGGTTNHWAGRCRPFENIDFEPRSYFNMPGWPIKKQEMDRYLSEAKSILDLEGAFKEEPGTVDFSASFVKDKSQVSKPTRFKEKYLKTITDAKNIDLIVHANVTRLNIDNDNRVEGVHLQNYDDHHHTLTANQYIIAMGGIENARILLLSDDKHQGGLGNHADMLGRCFMEHLNVNFGTFISNQDAWSHTKRMEYYTTADFVQKQSIGSANVTLNIVEEVRAYGRTRKIKEYLQRVTCELGFQDSIQHWVEFNCPGEGSTGTLCEQQPNLKSRVYLSDKLDSLGMRKLVIDWQLSEDDKKTIRVLAKETAKQMAEANIGRMKLHDFVLDESLDIPVSPHAHHMGTTRMSESPKAGVVDPNCKVHGIENLYVAGSSVFPTGSGVNPTMPLLQLTLRLTDYLTKQSKV
jgi:choline dehydrogenase-like flavoprotein